MYVGSDDKAIYSLSGATGSLNWKFTTNDPLLSFPGLGSDGSLLAACEGEFRIYSLNSRSGRVLWQFPQDPVPLTVTAPATSRRGR